MKRQPEIVLSPAQRRAFEGLLNGNAAGNVLFLKARPGSGRTSILRKLHGTIGGAILGVRDFMHSLSSRWPAAIEEAFLRRIEQALAHQNIVVVDDLHLVTQAAAACDYPRALLLDASLTAIVGEAAALRKRLVFGGEEEAPWPLARRAYAWKVGKFEPEDYACICRNLLGEAGEALDFARIHSVAPALTAEQLCRACGRLSRAKTLDTQTMIASLRS